MKTECPHCHTVFRVSEQTLLQSAGQVRCGHCLAIFAAEIPQQMSFDDLLEPQDTTMEVDAIAVATPNKKNIPHRIHRQPALNEAAIEMDIVFETAAAPPLVEVINVEHGVAETPDHVLADVIPPSLRAETRAEKKRFGFINRLIWSLIIWLMIGIGFAQYAWYDRMHWLQYPQTRPWFELACNYLHCQLPEPRDLSRIELSRKNIYTHPNDKHGLMVSGSMVNQVDYAQSFPILELRFENIRGETIAARRFIPEEYLDLPKDKISKMQPGEPVMFTLEIVDPGPDVVSYEFTFL